MVRDEDLSDVELLKRAASGSGASFGVLMRRHEDRIFGLAYRMLGDRSDALDATQDAFLAAFRRAGSFRGDSAVGTWMYRIAINACKDHARKKSRWTAREDVEEVDARASAHMGLDDRVAARLDVSEALAQLPDEYREAVVMHDIGGVPYEEIAAITGTMIGTVKSRISRGRRKLAELLEPHRASDSSKGVT